MFFIKENKGLLYFCLLSLFLLFLFLFLVSSLLKPKKSSQERKEDAAIPVLPLGISLYTSEEVEFFNRYATENDFISARPHSVDLLDQVEVGKKVLAFTGREDPREMVSLAKKKGVQIVGFNLEEPLSKEELVTKQKEVYELAKENSLTFVFGPTVVNLEKYYQDFAQYADVLVIQSQRYQVQADYEKIVEELIAKIKSANPKVEVRVVVTVAPPDLRGLSQGREIEKVYLSADQVIDNIRLIEDQADSVFIFSFPGQDPLDIKEEVFRKLRS